MEYERRERRGGYGGGYGRREGGRGGYGPRFPPKPVEIGKEYDVEIQETSRRGEGIARIKGLVVFVPNTKTGDKVKVRITRISQRFCEAEVVGAGEPKAEATEESSEVTAEEETSETTTEEETSEATTEEETETSTESTETDTETDTEDETESDTESM